MTKQNALFTLVGIVAVGALSIATVHAMGSTPKAQTTTETSGAINASTPPAANQPASLEGTESVKAEGSADVAGDASNIDASANAEVAPAPEAAPDAAAPAAGAESGASSDAAVK